MKLSSLINSRRLNEDQIAAAEELIDRGFNTVVDVAIGVGEVGLSMISGAVAEPASGLYGLGSLVFQGLDSAAGDIESIQNRMTYEPRTEAGKKGIGYLGSTIGKIGEAVDNFSGYLGDKVLDATDSPELSTIAATLPTAVFEILPTGKLPSSRVLKSNNDSPYLSHPDSHSVNIRDKTPYDFQDDQNVIVTHGGGKIDRITDEGAFGGLFASYGDKSTSGLSQNSNFQTTFQIPKDKVAKSGDVDLDYDKTIKELKFWFDEADDAEIDSLYRAIAEDAEDAVSDVSDLLMKYGDDPSWAAQYMRGKIAKDQGFSAVEMKDETGISVLIPHNYSPNYEIVYRDYEID